MCVFQSHRFITLTYLINLIQDYELVRYHHPDSYHCRGLPQDTAHARFQSITAAYDYLRGATKSPFPGAKRYGFDPDRSNFDPYLHELARRRRAQQAAQGASGWADGFGAPRGSRSENFREDGPKERMILAFGVIVSLFLNKILPLKTCFGSLKLIGSLRHWSLACIRASCFSPSIWIRHIELLP